MCENHNNTEDAPHLVILEPVSAQLGTDRQVTDHPDYVTLGWAGESIHKVIKVLNDEKNKLYFFL